METTKIDTSPDTLTVTFDFSKPQLFKHYALQVNEIVEELQRRAYKRGYYVGMRDGIEDSRKRGVEDRETIL